jgi:hypothetical protein
MNALDLKIYCTEELPHWMAGSESLFWVLSGQGFCRFLLSVF